MRFFSSRIPRIVSLLLVVVFLLLCLAACSSKPEATEATSRPTSSARTATTSRSSTTSTRKATEPKEQCYIGNKSSKKVHDPDCSYLPEEKNRVYFDDLDEALDDGYEPCKKCHPS